VEIVLGYVRQIHIGYVRMPALRRQSDSEDRERGLLSSTVCLTSVSQ
jgi:hypothetical protein